MAFCSNCGRELSPAAQFCPQCGTPTRGAVDTAATPEVVQATGEGQLEGMALASLISSIASFFILPILGSVLGIVFGNIATGRIAADPRLRGKEMARAGIIIGWVGIVLTVLAFLAVILFFVALDDIFN